MKYSETDLMVLRKLGRTTTQQAIATEIGYSVGKVNFVLKALVEKGLVKAERFVNAQSKIKYTYLLTEEGLKEKIALTQMFIERKKEEYDALQKDMQEYKEQGLVTSL